MVSAYFGECLLHLCIFAIHHSLGLVGITCNLGYSEPSNLDDPTSVEAAERAIQFDLGWFAHPILVDGEYPQVMRDMVGTQKC